MRTSPNIFRFATSELSQDAFFAWLASWGDAEYAATSPVMHNIGQRFIELLYARSGREVPHYTSVEAIRQRKRVDLLLKLAGPSIPDHYVLIEDKIYTTDHADQVSGYIAALRNDGIRGDILPIYLKTWVEGRRPCDFVRLYLPDVIAFLDTIDLKAASSEILSSWCEMMRAAHTELTSYSSLPFSSWGDTQWTGCFHRLSTFPQLASLDIDFEYVSNAAGGFMACTLGWQANPQRCYLYVQVDAYSGKYHRLTFRVDAGDGERVDLELARNLCGTLRTIGASNGYSIEEPMRLKSGRSSCFAVLNAPIFSEEGGEHFVEELALRQIQDCHRMLSECARQFGFTS